MDDSQFTFAPRAAASHAPRSADDPSSASPIAAAWRDDRAYLLAVAARILRHDGQPEDVVAEAFTRLAAQPEGSVRDVRGWLIVVTRRVALDRLRSAHSRLSEPVDATDPLMEVIGERLHARIDGGSPVPVDPADRVTLDDEIRRALSVVVDRLTPGERAAFLLHDVFGVPFDEIGVLIGRSAAACRQLASRARASIRAAGPASPDRAPRPASDLDRVAQRFAVACADGDVAGLAALLHHDASGWAMRRGVVLNEVHGRAAISSGVTAFFGPRSSWDVAPFPLDDAAAVLVTRGGEPAGVMRLVVDERGLITQLRAVLLGTGSAESPGRR